MKKIAITFILLLLQILTFAQEKTNRQTTTTFPENGKYEIITSSLTMRDTYMLNRETGDTWQLVKSLYGYALEKIYKEQNIDDKIPDGYAGAVYQITLSGIAAKGTYLTNTLTGATWTLYKNENDELFLGAIDSPK